MLAEPASAGVISANPTLYGPVGINDVAPVLTTAPNNDNDTAPTNPANRVELLDLEFLAASPIDVVFPISNSGGVTEYALGLGTSLGFIATSIINSSGSAWSGMRVQVGTGNGGTFTPIGLGSGLDFDTPHGDPLPASDVFPFFQNWGNKMNFVGATVASGDPGDAGDLFAHFMMTASLDLPDGIGSEFTLRLEPLLAAEIGQIQDNPILPTVIDSDVIIFEGATRGRWFDPPTAYGFEYTMLDGGDLFTGILDFPSGFADEFEVTVGSTSLGLFGPGDTVTFDGAGVSSFKITGINPLVDPANPSAFPLLLDFNNETVDFSMAALEAVPEPSTLALLGLGLVVFSGAARRRRGM